MSATPDLDFRPLEKDEGELAAEFTAAAGTGDAPDEERFGLEGGKPPTGSGQAWGLFVRGVLCGVAWLRPPSGGTADVPALTLARQWRGAGLTGWMLTRLAQAAAEAGASRLRVRLAEKAAPVLGEILSDADFSGPDLEAEEYPAGEWIRMARR